MYKLTKSKEGINVSKLHGELGDLGLPYFLTHNDTEFFLSFPDVKREETQVLDENETVIDTVVTFKKRVESTVTETDEEGNEVEKKVTDWVEFDFTPIQIQIDEAIASHVPVNVKEVKRAKRQEIKQSCHRVIINGFDTDIKYGEPKHYSLDEFAQKNIDDQMIQLQAGEIKNALWHDDSRVIHDLWNYAEFKEFFTQYKMFILSCRLKSDILEEKVIAVTDVAELDNISFDNPLSEEEQSQIDELITGMMGTTEV